MTRRGENKTDNYIATRITGQELEKNTVATAQKMKSIIKSLNKKINKSN